MSMGFRRKIDLQDDKIRRALLKAKIAYEKAGERKKSIAMEKEFKKYAGFTVCRDSLRKYIKLINQEDKNNVNNKGN
ncbi:hypothetical protein D2962_08280 [Biomaibacter acetigenes]|uniref:Uncharacterized protein n=1 Tax=Biomaibacter acetigenes TaxID=2316383 RepID=A0A3G2R599_9FIRM|nr:hypothetical protein [Biomaibacter acetigenes]AYO30620.1 hypothetical protein D2962_08280 [Biomaibacter acetigenes]